MHAKSWFILTISFSLGIVCAFVVAYYTFDAKPVEVYDPGPTIKILVTKKEIPRGAEVEADAVVFKDAPLSELPEAALTDFTQVYRQRAAFPLPMGYPVCKDFLLSPLEDESQESTFLPPGSRIVSLEVEQLRVGDSVSHLLVPLTTFLSVEQKIDVRTVPRDGAKGIYVQRRQQLLRDNGIGIESEQDGEIVLEDIVVHRIVGNTTEDGARQVQTLSLILGNEDAAKLVAAAKKGTLRVVPRDGSVEVTKNVDELVAEKPVAAAPTASEAATKIVESESPRPEVVKTEVEPTVTQAETVQTEAVKAEMTESLNVEPETQIMDVADSGPSETGEENDVAPLRMSQSGTPKALRAALAAGESTDAPTAMSGTEKNQAVVSFVAPTTIPSDCEPETVSPSRQPGSPENPGLPKNEVKVEEQVIKAPKKLPVFQFIGSKEENASNYRGPSYSPFDTRSRLAEPTKKESEEMKNDESPAPTSLRSSKSIFVH